MSFIYFDIETIPNQDPGAIERAMAEIKPPSRITKPESIEKWLAENREEAAREAVAKTSFDGGYGHVCTIAWAHDDDEIKSVHASDVSQEGDALAAFFGDLPEYHSTTIVGHNILGFDIPFLTKRAIVLGARLPRATAWPRDPKPWDKSCHDTMIMWAGGRGTISMDKLCAIFGLEGKGDGMHGSEVAQAWLDGRHDEIEDYCRHDVEQTRAVHKRFMAAGW